MKQLFTIILAAFYFLVTSGFTVDIHFCDGRLIEVNFFDANQQCCCTTPACEKEVVNNCCGDETLLLQVDQWQIVSNVPAYETPLIADLKLQDWVEPVAVIDTRPFTEKANKSPPRNEALWLLYQNFTYYG